jgi:hypothetical protein
VRTLPTKDRLACVALPPECTMAQGRGNIGGWVATLGRWQIGCGVLRCQFSNTGFPFDNGKQARLCHSAHHKWCLLVSAPFVSHRKNGAGLCFPDITEWGTFICKACTVRVVVNRKLTAHMDGKLLPWNACGSSTWLTIGPLALTARTRENFVSFVPLKISTASISYKPLCPSYTLPAAWISPWGGVRKLIACASPLLNAVKAPAWAWPFPWFDSFGLQRPSF